MMEFINQRHVLISLTQEANNFDQHFVTDLINEYCIRDILKYGYFSFKKILVESFKEFGKPSARSE